MGIFVPLGVALIASLVIIISCKKQSIPIYEKQQNQNQTDLVNLSPNMSNNKTEQISKISYQ